MTARGLVELGRCAGKVSTAHSVKDSSCEERVPMAQIAYRC